MIMSREEQIERMLFDARCREASALGHARREGRQEGIEEGMRKKAEQTARNMKNMDIDVDTIAKATGLFVDDILRL